MAEARKHECIICLDNFTKPKILPCFHTFCEECLEKHIQAHVHDNKFNCPICRRNTEVPEGGASRFTTNFYLDEPNLNQKHYCIKHQEKELEFYCRDCCVAACGNCVITRHKLHTVVDLREVDEEYRIKLTSSVAKLEERIQQLNAHKQLLQMKSASIIASAASACNNIDSQVENIYAEAQKLGTIFKGDVNKLRDVEIEKLQKLLDEEDSLISQLQTAVDYSSKSLTATSTQSLIDIAPYVETISGVSDNLSTNDEPVAKHPYVPLVAINTDLLKQQLGALQTTDEPTFTASFDLEEIKEQDKDYCGEDFTIQGLPWCVYVQHHIDTSLGIFLCLKQGDDETVTSCTADRTFTLLHQTDDSKSVEEKYTDHVYKTGDGGWGWSKFIEWNKLTDPNNGFLKNNRFTVQTSVKITNIDRNDTCMYVNI